MPDTKPMPDRGKSAPALHLPDDSGGKIRLSQFKGDKPVVLYFYPKDDTPGCTKEACHFRDDIAKYRRLGAEVIGISPDSVAKHQKFKEKYDLPFTLLADEAKEAAMKYGVWVEKNMYGRKYMGVQRATFLIDRNGKIAAVWPKVKVTGHSEEVLAALKEL